MTRPRSSPTRPKTGPPLPFLLVTAAVSGGLIMVIEVLGSRVIGPFFGVSLFVWTALITTTLLALAAGYAAGGWVADRRTDASTLYGLLLAAGVATLLVPALKTPILQLTADLGLRTGALTASILLFGPSLFLLGCVSPFVVRLAAPDLDRIGRTVGLFYAVSTVGSFVGTVTTGFYLLAWIGVRGIFLLVGASLIALGGSWFALFRRRPAALLLLVAPLLIPAPAVRASKRLANGTEVARIHHHQGFYAELQVLDYSGSAYRTRELLLDGLIQGGIDRDNGLSVYAYSYLLERLALGLVPDARTCLVVGLGAGVVPRRLESAGLTCDVVDIDPQVVDAARDFFGFSLQGGIEIADARRFLRSGDRTYDVIVLDVFTGDTTPGHLLTVEAISELEARLSDDGVMVANLMAALGPEARMTASIVRTLETAFDTVRLFPLFDATIDGGFGNVVVAAHDGPRREPADRSPRLPVHPLALEEVRRGLRSEVPLPRHPGALLLSDDYNPIDLFDLELKEKVRRSILLSNDREMLLL